MVGLTRRQRVVLAALAANAGARLAPVQVQKLFFLLDENISADLGGKQFGFQPYDYGPFDRSVYQELELLRDLGLVEISQVAFGPGGRRYGLTPNGTVEGNRELVKLPASAANYMTEVSKWVARLSFAELVGSIYKAFPQMRVNSIFVE